ncbi:rod shape-determining protein [Streptomyces sp. NPDC056949]|uniref:rod shape-determining protein n=1 Tax=Streptomyces sp. NPDC056949 TaxID=3345976 RepID=UPI0036261D94
MTLSRPHQPMTHRHIPWLADRLAGGLAIDLGSARTRAWMPGHGVILDVPSVTFPGAGPATYPIQHGTIVDPDGTARMLDRLLARRVPRRGRPLIVLTTPVPSGAGHRAAALTALEVLRPRAVLTVPTAKAIALAVRADLGRPLLVVDVGAHLTEVALLTDGAVTDAYRTALGTTDLDATTTVHELTEAVVSMLTSMVRLDRTTQARGALKRGVLVAGGGALRPELTDHLAHRLHTSVQPVPAPQTAALRGAAEFLRSAQRHPAVRGSRP